MPQTLIKNGTIAAVAGVFTGDVLIEGGVIRAVGADLNSGGAEVIDAAGLIVLPGGVDAHVHLPWPTGSHISTDTFASGSRASAFGGVTSILDFCIPRDDETLHSVLERKKEEARKEAWVDYSFHLNIRQNAVERVKEIPPLTRAGFPSFKVFMAYEGFRLEDADLRGVLEAARMAGALVNVHAEDGLLADRITADLVKSGRKSLRDFPRARPAEVEEDAIHRLLHYQQQTGARVHIHHVSTRGGVKAIADARRAGRRVSGETCPHYLLFTSADYAGAPDRAASLVCAPSIKDASHQQALWQGLADGTLTVLATDHCPYTRAQKQAEPDDFTQTPGGMGGVELRLPLLYTEGVLRGRLTLEQFTRVWAEGPARAFGLFPRKGQIAPGADADLVLLDPGAEWTVRAAELHMNTDYLPYEGMRLKGSVQAVMLRGYQIIRGGALQADSRGILIPRWLPD